MSAVGVQPPVGGTISGLWVPIELWVRLCTQLDCPADRHALRQCCRVALHAMSLVEENRIEAVLSQFSICTVSVPQALAEKVLMAHVVPTQGDSVVLFVDESDVGRGVELVWVKGNVMHQIALGIDDAHPASSVSNVRFAPGGCSVAMLVTMNTQSIHGGHDPFVRLRGYEAQQQVGNRMRTVRYKPSEDCTVQIVELLRDERGTPSGLRKHTYADMFVPEYGFDLVWRPGRDGAHPELDFAAMLHAKVGAVTYLVRWSKFVPGIAAGYVFMGRVHGTSAVVCNDKRKAMAEFSKTRITSRIELSSDAKALFYDTVSRFGVLKFDQLEDPKKTKVVRAELLNDRSPFQYQHRGMIQPGLYNSCRRYRRCSTLQGHEHVLQNRGTAATKNYSTARELKLLPSWPVGFGKYARVTRISPDGNLLCSVLNSEPTFYCARGDLQYGKCIEMRNFLTGKIMFQVTVARPSSSFTDVPHTRIRYEKSCDVVQNTLGFSTDSSLVWVRDVRLTPHSCTTTTRLPMVLDSRSGRVVQEFPSTSRSVCYEHLEISPDALTVYGTRYMSAGLAVDAIDVISGRVIKSVKIQGPIDCQLGAAPFSAFLMQNRDAKVLSRGEVDALWHYTRGAVGCGWTATWKTPEADA